MVEISKRQAICLKCVIDELYVSESNNGSKLDRKSSLEKLVETSLIQAVACNISLEHEWPSEVVKYQ